MLDVINKADFPHEEDNAIVDYLIIMNYLLVIHEFIKLFTQGNIEASLKDSIAFQDREEFAH